MYSNRTRLTTRWLLVVGLPLIASARVRTGLDVLVEQDFAPLAGKRVGIIITNENSLTFDHRGFVAKFDFRTDLNNGDFVESP